MKNQSLFASLVSILITVPAFCAETYVELLQDPNFLNGIKTNPLSVRTLGGTPHRVDTDKTKVFYCGDLPAGFNSAANTKWWFNQLGTFKDVYKNKVGPCKWDNGMGGSLMLPPVNGSQALKLGLGSYKVFGNTYPRYWNEYYPGPEGTSFKPNQHPYPNAKTSYTGVTVDAKNNDFADFYEKITSLQIPIGTSHTTSIPLGPSSTASITFFRSSQDQYIFDYYIGNAVVQDFRLPLSDLAQYSNLIFSADVKLGTISHLADKLGAPGFRKSKHGGSLIANIFFNEKSPRVCNGVEQKTRTIVLQVQFFSVDPYMGCEYDKSRDAYVKKPDYDLFVNQYAFPQKFLFESCERMAKRELLSGDPVIPNQIMYAIDSAKFISSKVPGSNRHLLVRGNDDAANDFTTIRFRLKYHLQQAINFLNKSLGAKDAGGNVLACNAQTMSDYRLSVFNLSWETNSLISGSAEIKNLSLKGVK